MGRYVLFYLPWSHVVRVNLSKSQAPREARRRCWQNESEVRLVKVWCGPLSHCVNGSDLGLFWTSALHWRRHHLAFWPQKWHVSAGWQLKGAEIAEGNGPGAGTGSMP